MCQGIQQVYAQCGHERNVEITEPCPVFSKHSSFHACTVHIIYTKTISEPLRCTECFRRVERNMIKEFEIKIEQVETQMQLLTMELRAEMDVEKRAEMRKKKSELVEALGDLKDRRNEEIAEFRFRQGAGADRYRSSGNIRGSER